MALRHFRRRSLPTASLLRARQPLSTSNAFTNTAVRILEVAPRDGLQNIKTQVSTAIKTELIERLAATGLRNIEATSFIPPKWIPQLADSHNVMAQIGPWARRTGLQLPVLVPNTRGLENVIKAGATSIEVFASATEGFSKANQNCSVDQALDMAETVAGKALATGLIVRGVTSCVFADPYTGPTEHDQVLYVVDRLIAMGCHEVGLGDTLGVGTSGQTRRLLERLLGRIGADKLAGHFHDTYGQALANVSVAYDLGLRSFDASVAGLGGCPYAKGAQGNLATEDLVYMLENSGIETGVDLVELCKVGDWISKLLGVPNRSRTGAAMVAGSNTSTSPTSDEKKLSDSKWQEAEALEGVDVYRLGTAVKIILNRPRKGNSLTPGMLQTLTRLFNTLSEDPSIFHIVLAAKGKYFCTGMDLSSGTDRTSTEGGYYDLVRGLFQAIEYCQKVTIAQVDGPAYGGGVGLAFACDVRIVSQQAKFALSEVKLGVQPAIISRFMAREWGFPLFREAVLSGRDVHAAELLRVGAVHSIAPDAAALDIAVDDYLTALAKSAPGAAAKCKELVRLSWLDADGPQHEAAIEECFSTMMEPGSEGEYGISQLQKKEPTDWVAFLASRLEKRRTQGVRG
jgi:hydroxymethylglutaryl-CoA lyase